MPLCSKHLHINVSTCAECNPDHAADIRESMERIRRTRRQRLTDDEREQRREAPEWAGYPLTWSDEG